MIIVYLCQNCQEEIKQEVVEDDFHWETRPSLTGEEQHDIMKKESGNRCYVESICHQCLKDFYKEKPQSFSIC